MDNNDGFSPFLRTKRGQEPALGPSSYLLGRPLLRHKRSQLRNKLPIPSKLTVGEGGRIDRRLNKLFRSLVALASLNQLLTHLLLSRHHNVGGSNHHSAGANNNGNHGGGNHHSHHGSSQGHAGGGGAGVAHGPQHDVSAHGSNAVAAASLPHPPDAWRHSIAVVPVCRLTGCMGICALIGCQFNSLVTLSFWAISILYYFFTRVRIFAVTTMVAG